MNVTIEIIQIHFKDETVIEYFQYSKDQHFSISAFLCNLETIRGEIHLECFF